MFVRFLPRIVSVGDESHGQDFVSGQAFFFELIVFSWRDGPGVGVVENELSRLACECGVFGKQLRWRFVISKSTETPANII
jgi:hypothetical protein